MSLTQKLWLGRELTGVVVAACTLLAATACQRETAPHDHTDEHASGHDHHEEGHGHGDEPMVKITRWSDDFEVYAEFAPPVAGKPTSLFVHVTRLDGFSPAPDGSKLRCALESGGSVAAQSEPTAATKPGVYTLTLTAPAAGTYRAACTVEGPTSGRIDGFHVDVAATEEGAEKSAPPEEHDGLVEMLKEQQWSVPFSTAFAKEGSVTRSIEVAGSVDTPPSGSARVGAPIAGRVVEPKGGLPRPGATVKKGQLLATLAPAPSSPEHAARASLAVVEAKARASAAQVAVERARRLIADEAISQRELEDAEREAAVADEAVKSATRAAALFSGASGGGHAGTWRLVAPIAGTLTAVRATPGASVSGGDELFHIVDTTELWIRARVPEQDAARLRATSDGHYQVAGLDEWVPLTVAGEAPTASVVTIGKTVDTTSRTVDVIYSLSSPHAALRVGGLVQVSLPVGDEFRGVVVPRTAVVNDDGRHVVYVQVDGEHFAERLVVVAAHAGSWVGIERGITAGERIVTRGANLVRLADRASSAQPHGHVH